MSVYMSRGILLYCGALACVLGAVFGSFLNCAAWRIAHGESFLRGRSHCPTCGHELGARDLVPVLSWAFQRGRCRYCGEKISVRYPLTELAFALLTLLCLLRFDLTVLCLRNWIFLCCLFCLSLVDLESYAIPDGCLLVGLGAWLAALPFLRPGLWDIGRSLLAGLCFGGGILLLSLVMDRLLGKESLGGGDVKLFALVGLYLGFAGGLFAMLFSCVLGLLFAFARSRERESGKAIPFGPSISLAAAAMLLWGEGLIHWYLGLMGL